MINAVRFIDKFYAKDCGSLCQLDALTEASILIPLIVQPLIEYSSLLKISLTFDEKSANKLKLSRTYQLLKTYRPLWVVGLLLCCTMVQGQNLIPNPSFENFNDYYNQELGFPWQGYPRILEWHYNSYDLEAGLQSDSIRKAHPNDNQFYRPYHGQSHLRIQLLNNNLNGSLSKATVQAQLNDSLQEGCYYRFSMYVLPEAVYPIEPNPMDPYSRTANYASAKSLGAYFSKNPILDTASAPGHAFDSLDIKPQIRLPQNQYITDTTNYTRISGTFKAQGGERYITLGYFGWLDTMKVYKFREQQVFDTTENWIVFYCIDSLNLYRTSPPGSLLTTSRDTALCPGDSLQLFINAREALSWRWDNGSTDSLRTITQPGTYWVDAYYNCGDVLSDTIVVSPLQVLPTIAVNDTTVCKGEKVTYNLPGNDVTYTLNGGPVGSTFSVSTAGQYLLKASNTCESQDFTFELNYKPVDDLPNLNITDTALCSGEEMMVKLPVDFSYTLNGIPHNNFNLLLTEQNDYVLEADNSCETRSYAFTINDDGCEMELYIPNAFTPNGDGLNDCFEIYITEYESFQVMVFNRWGQKVFESHDPTICWDGTFNGKPVFGNHTYIVKANDGGKERVEYGIVTVLR